MARKTLATFLLGCFLAVSAATDAGGMLEGPSLEASADINIISDYVWRGFILDDDPVMQQGVYVNAYGFSVSIWGSFDIDGNDSLSSDEVDYVIDYTREFNKLSLSAGHTYYDFPLAGAASKEFYLAAKLDTPLSPTLTWYRDYGKETSGGGDGDYIVLGTNHDFPFEIGSVTLNVSGHIGYNNKLFINGEGGDAALGIGLTIPLSDNCSLSSKINYSMPYGDLKDSNDGSQDDKLYGGFTLAFGL